MAINVYQTQLSQLSKHKDLRCGLGLIPFQNVVNEFASSTHSNIKLGKILSLEYGKSLTEEERTGTGYPVVGSNGIVGYHEDFLVEGPCIIVGRKGSAGEVVYIENNCFPIDTTFFVQLLRPDLFHLKFLFYLLKELNLQRLALFKGVPGLNRYDVYEARIPVIPLDMQVKTLAEIETIEQEIKLLQEKINSNSRLLNEQCGLLVRKEVIK